MFNVQRPSLTAQNTTLAGTMHVVRRRTSTEDGARAMFVVLSGRLVSRFRRIGGGQDALRHERRAESRDRARWTMEPVGWGRYAAGDDPQPAAATAIGQVCASLRLMSGAGHQGTRTEPPEIELQRGTPCGGCDDKPLHRARSANIQRNPVSKGHSLGHSC